MADGFAQIPQEQGMEMIENAVKAARFLADIVEPMPTIEPA